MGGGGVFVFRVLCGFVELKEALALSACDGVGVGMTWTVKMSDRGYRPLLLDWHNLCLGCSFNSVVLMY